MKTKNSIFKFVTLRSVTILLMSFAFGEALGQSGGKTEPMSEKPPFSKYTQCRWSMGISGNGVRSSSPPIKSNTNVNPNLTGRTLKNNINFSPSLFVEANYGRWGFITEVGFFKSTIHFDAENYLSKISSFTTVKINENQWTSMYMQVGSCFTITGNKSRLTLMLKGGIVNNISPEMMAMDTGSTNTIYLAEGKMDVDHDGDWPKNFPLAISGGIKYTYSASKFIGIHFQVNYMQQLGSRNHIITYKDLSNVDFSNSGKAREQVMQAPDIEYKISPPIKNLMLGIGISFNLVGGIMDNDMGTIRK
ncbi:MAG: hypothetical protein Q8K70_11160 [Bacteroidota bacterium]|nr:hypothetical protein [Bacteroidota bacterium]